MPGNEGRGVGATLGEAAIGPVPAAPYQTPASETRSTPPGSTKKSVSPRTPSAAPGSPAMVRLCQSAPSVELHRPNGGFPSAEPMTTMRFPSDAAWPRVGGKTGVAGASCQVAPSGLEAHLSVTTPGWNCASSDAAAPTEPP